MEIVTINHQNLADINKANQPFEIIGKIKPTFAGGVWAYTEEIYGKSYIKAYPNDLCDYEVYINNPDKTDFFAYSGIGCIGQIILKRDWNCYAFIEDIWRFFGICNLKSNKIILDETRERILNPH